MRTTYIANSSESANLHSGKQTAIVTLVKPQPIPSNSDKTAYNFDMRNSKHFHMAQNVSVEDMNTRFRGILDFAPYQPGQTIAVRESWHIRGWLNGMEHYAYKADGESCPTTRCDEEIYNTWRSPVTMPREAVRTWLLVKDVCCVRVQDMTSEQAQTIWPDTNNIERMQDLHRKFGSDAWADNVFVFITTIEKQ